MVGGAPLVTYTYFLQNKVHRVYSLWRGKQGCTAPILVLDLLALQLPHAGASSDVSRVAAVEAARGLAGLVVAECQGRCARAWLGDLRPWGRPGGHC